jgi:hypothetical protein
MREVKRRLRVTPGLTVPLRPPVIVSAFHAAGVRNSSGLCTRPISNPIRLRTLTPRGGGLVSRERRDGAALAIEPATDLDRTKAFELVWRLVPWPR